MVIPRLVRTNRIVLRPFEPSDAESLFSAAQETQQGLFDWYGGALSASDLSPETVTTFIHSCLKDFEDKTFLQYGAFNVADGALVGAGSLHHLDWTVPKGRIGYWVRNKDQGKGYATKIAHALTLLAFQKLKFERLEIRTEVRNKPSSAVAKKLGYHYLTVFEKNKRGANGDLWDLEIYALLNSTPLPPMDISYE